MQVRVQDDQVCYFSSETQNIPTLHWVSSYESG